MNIHKYIKDADLVKNVSNQHLKFLLYTLKNKCVIKSIYIGEKERQGGKYREKETARRKKEGKELGGKRWRGKDIMNVCLQAKNLRL